MVSFLKRRVRYSAADGDGLVITKHLGLVS
jgi:hypothetical protein